MGDVFSMLIGYVLGLICAVVAYNNRIDEWVEEAQKTKELLKKANNWLKAFYAYEPSEFVRAEVAKNINEIDELLGDNTDE